MIHVGCDVGCVRAARERARWLIAMTRRVSVRPSTSLVRSKCSRICLLWFLLIFLSFDNHPVNSTLTSRQESRVDQCRSELSNKWRTVCLGFAHAHFTRVIYKWGNKRITEVCYFFFSTIDSSFFYSTVEHHNTHINHTQIMLYSVIFISESHTL